MNDVRDSRRKHLDELDKGDGMKEEMIEKLKTTWTTFGYTICLECDQEYLDDLCECRKKRMKEKEMK